MTDTIESLRGRLTLAQREINVLRACVADEMRLRKSIQKDLTEELARTHAEVAALKLRLSTITDE